MNGIVPARSCKYFTAGMIIVMLGFFLPQFACADKGTVYDDLFGVTFSTEKDGWASGRWGTILHTSDGGKTWEQQNSGTDYTLSAIHFIDQKNGWAVGDEGTIVATKDGGKTWAKQKSPVSYFLMDVYFLTPSRGFIVTERTHILSTDDGGKTWKVQFKDEDYILKALSFCNTEVGWAVGEFGYIYRTKDGGNTWEKQAGFSDLSAETGELVGGTYLFDVKAISPDVAWAVGIEGHVINTINGGKTWQQVKTGTPKVPLFSITSKADSLFIAGNGLLLISDDSGKTWKKPMIKPPITYTWLYGISARSLKDIVLVGQGGTIYAGSREALEKKKY
ncbi:MAG: WD40/YVTN/BNR-like repeat-containing protein [Syntrophorhabdaceae bacterium]